LHDTLQTDAKFTDTMFKQTAYDRTKKFADLTDAAVCTPFYKQAARAATSIPVMESRTGLTVALTPVPSTPVSKDAYESSRKAGATISISYTLVINFFV
jgi:hypothetical protein